MLYTIMRLRYPYKLDEGHQDRLLKYYQRHREQAKKFFVSKFNKEALKVMAELDEMLSLENKEPNLNLEQKKPYELMNKGYNVFLTGAAASGKTHLLREFVEMQWLKGHMEYHVHLPENQHSILKVFLFTRRFKFRLQQL